MTRSWMMIVVEDGLTKGGGRAVEAAEVDGVGEVRQTRRKIEKRRGLKSCTKESEMRNF